MPPSPTWRPWRLLPQQRDQLARRRRPADQDRAQGNAQDRLKARDRRPAPVGRWSRTFGPIEQRGVIMPIVRIFRTGPPQQPTYSYGVNGFPPVPAFSLNLPALRSMIKGNWPLAKIIET